MIETFFVVGNPVGTPLVSNEWPDLNDHFGKSEHACGHWIDLNMQVGYF